jgi:glucose/arabinose dehydrogenase
VRPLLVLAFALALAAPAQAAPALVTVGDFESPVHVAGSPGDSHRLFVVEQIGRVQLVVDGAVQPTPFLDISADVLSGGERGLLSIAFPPDYQTSGRFYVYLTARDDGRIEVREYRRADLDRADPSTERTLLTIPHPNQSNHNGGQLQFGPDGKLWIGTGDGGGANDTEHNAQNPASRLGKILRMDPLTGALDTYALGIRNPWRFSFDRATNDLVIADVGQGAREEVDFAPAASIGAAGVNYGWPCFEGTRVNTEAPREECATPPANPVAPVFERSHAGDVCSITGGYVVRDPGLPTLAGRYLYGDLCGSALRSIDLGDPSSDRAEPLPIAQVTSFGQDACGRLYVASLRGPVSRIEDGAATPCGATPATGGGPPGGTPAPPDTTTPQLKTHVTGVHSLARRRRLRVVVTTSEPVTAVLAGRLRGVASFRTARLQLPAGRTAVRLRISKRTARELRRALRHKPRVIAALTITLRDDAGNTRRGTRRVKIRG